MNNERVERSWWSRHWKWLVPVCILIPVLVCGGLITVVMSGLTEAMKSTPPYTQSLAIVRANTEAQTLLGIPIEPGVFVGGDMQLSSRTGGGHAELHYAVSGPTGAGTVNLIADQKAGAWTFARLDLTMDETKKRVELLFPE